MWRVRSSPHRRWRGVTKGCGRVTAIAGSDRAKRHGQRRGAERRGQQRVPERWRLPTQGGVADQSDEQHDRSTKRDFDHGGHDASSRARRTSASMRSSSSGVSWPTSVPSSAATTFARDPSKNVSTRCRSADRRAECRGTVGA